MEVTGGVQGSCVAPVYRVTTLWDERSNDNSCIFPLVGLGVRNHEKRVFYLAAAGGCSVLGDFCFQ